MKITREQAVEWSNNAQAAGFRIFPASPGVRIKRKKRGVKKAVFRALL